MNQVPAVTHQYYHFPTIKIENYTPPDPSQIVEQLGLTEEQIAQLNQIRRQFSPLIEPLYEEWNKAQQELETLIVSTFQAFFGRGDLQYIISY